MSDIKNKLVGFLRRNLQVDEVSLVDKGANPGAKVVLTKFDNRVNIDPNPINGDPPAMTVEELQKALAAQKAEVEKTLGEITSVKAELTSVQADLSKAQEAKKMAEDELEKMKQKDCKKPPEGELDEDMKKKLDPAVTKSFEAMQKRLEESEKLHKELADKLELQSLEKQAEQAYPNIPGEPVQKAVLLRTVNSLPEVQKKYMEEVLTSANKALESRFTAIGNNTSEVLKGDANQQFDALVKNYAKEHGVSEIDANEAVLKTAEGQALYAKLSTCS